MCNDELNWECSICNVMCNDEGVNQHEMDEAPWDGIEHLTHRTANHCNILKKGFGGL